MTAAPAVSARTRFWLGSALALASSITFSLNLALARLSYDSGANALAVNLVRTIFLSLCLFIFLKATGRPASLPRRERTLCLLLGLVWAVQMVGLLVAIVFIPVGLVVLTYYTYPLMIAAIAAAMGGERLTAPSLALMVLAFVGLIISLQVPEGTLDWRGVALALVSALSMASVMILSERFIHGRDSRIVTLHIMLGVLGVLVLMALAGGELSWPSDLLGWATVAGAAIFLALAITFLFMAIGLIGPLRTSMIDNGSPVWSILFAALLLGEMLSPLQLSGALLVVAAIIANQVLHTRQQPIPRGN